ncbi:MAG: DUF2156 domain-containing protein [Paracoccaceae bacterium]|nr:DUF2156 domain-containing protein [Paracoccaceae bacterium]
MGLFFRTLDSLLDRRAAKAPDREVPMELRWRLLKRHGDFPLAYPAVTEPYLSAFGDARGMVIYGQKMGTTFALGDQIAGEEHRKDLISEFIAAFGAPVFVACQRHTAEALSAFGYSVNALGYDSRLDLKELSFAGGDFKRIRYASNWLATNGMTVVEEREIEVNPKALRKMSRQWRTTRVNAREIRFLNRAFEAEASPGVRRFFAVRETGDPVGFIGFDPIFSDEQVIGYLASQKRRISEGSAYLDLAIMRAAIDTFKQEGAPAVYLGISPAADIGSVDFAREVGWLRAGLQAAHRSDWVNARFFNSRGLAEYKNRFRGRRIPLYLCFPPRGSNMMKVIAFLRLIRLV